MNICWAHYRRKKRGAKIEGAVRGWGTGQILVSGPQVAPQVLEMVTRAAGLHPSPSGEASKFEVQRRVVKQWLARWLGGRQPWLMENKALMDPVTSPQGYKSVGKVPLTPEEHALLKRAIKETGLNSHALLVAVMDDWFYYWLDHQRAPKGSESLNPYKA